MRTLISAICALVFPVFVFAQEASWYSLPIEEWGSLPRECTSWYHSPGGGECPAVTTMHGFKVHISPSLWRGGDSANKRSVESFYSRLGSMVYEYGIPEAILEEFRKAAIYLAKVTSDSDLRFPCDWSVTGCIGYGQTTQVGINLQWNNARRSILMHEFAHIYHEFMIPDGYDNNCIQLIYQNVTEKKNLYQYEKRHYFVPDRDTRPVHDENPEVTGPLYAGVNHREWFAEVSARYWIGAAEYYPFDRYDLHEYDPLGYLAMFFLWQPEFLPQMAGIECSADDF